MNFNSYYSPPNRDVWQGRVDESSPQRFHEVIQFLDINEVFNLSLPAIVFLGFASDEGVRRNQGRVGAKEGPLALRKALANLPIRANSSFQYFDAGDITCDNGNLEEAQNTLADIVSTLLNNHAFPIVLGGGHEVAWGHFKGIHNAYPDSPCQIINIDAHFDLRPIPSSGEGSSGTSFTQIAELLKSKGKPFDYTCLGIQRSGNTPSLFQKAKEQQVKVFFADDFPLKNPLPLSSDNIYLTICLDAFSAAIAPGVSAPQPLGLFPDDILPILRQLASSGNVISLDIAELSPPHDIDSHTEKLAAAIIAEWIYHLKTP